MVVWWVKKQNKQEGLEWYQFKKIKKFQLFDCEPAELKLIQDAALPHTVAADGGAHHFR